MIITIDGPAGAGKSTIAKELASQLGYAFLDTGSMYRAVTLAAIRAKIELGNVAELGRFAGEIRIEIDGGRTFLDGEDVTQAVRSQEVTKNTHYASDNPAVRGLMVGLQRKTATELLKTFPGVVTEGRDQGSVVFPDSPCKIFLTATLEERTRRRIGEMEARGEHGDFEDILEKINRRDISDSTREVGPLTEPSDSIRLVTDGMDIPAVLSAIRKIIPQKG